ncbi:MAG TPA: 6-phosphogluconolactonase [Nitrospirales bacterium]|jgi:6-phosphogluconolactonase
MDYSLEIVQGAEELARKGAERFIALAGTARQEHRPFRVALAGGNTPATLYKTLSSSYRTKVDWSIVEFFFGDDRAVPPDHPDSNFRLAAESLFRPAGIPSRQIHRMRGEMEDLDAASELYSEELGPWATDDLPRFDLVLLGMGPDGHTASLFPNSAILEERTRWVVPVFDSPKPPPRRLTLTLPVLNAAHQVIFLVSGKDKAPAVREVLKGNAPGAQYPVKLVRPRPDRLLWLLDQEAASQL